jgi:hypothetical protein
MITRRGFIQQTALAILAAAMPKPLSLFINKGRVFTYESPFFKLQLLRDRPEFSFFSTDSLCGRRFPVNLLLITDRQSEGQYESSINSNSIIYFSRKGQRDIPVWKISMQPKIFSIRTRWNKEENPDPLAITFSQKTNHCTLLGVMPEKNIINFPCVMHFPGMGSFRIYCSDPAVTIFYDADRDVKDPFVKIALSAADAQHRDITYRFDPVAVYPELDKIKNDVRFDGFKRNYINIFQLNPRIRALANNSASDACTFTLFLYAEMARHTPELVKGFSAMDLIRNTLDEYIGGMKGYGQVGYKGDAWKSKFDSSDSAPSLIISACYYIMDAKDNNWAKKNYAYIKDWALSMIATDKDHDGIIEYGYSGNSNSWNDKEFKRPANWWDTIGFGHDDAYSNALAYRACTLLVKVAEALGQPDDSYYFDAFAKKLKSQYFSRFYNPDTGVLGGWRSEDGQLHDYFFTFVNSVAICYDLIDIDKARQIMHTLLSKMREVGYIDFRLGLPGNLIPIADKDYTDHNPRFGYQKFQVYENGGATGCYVYYTIHALYKLGMRPEAEAILFPMLESYKMDAFQGYSPHSDMANDWKTWKGEGWGYEGFLVDNYLALLTVLDYSKSF